MDGVELWTIPYRGQKRLASVMVSGDDREMIGRRGDFSVPAKKKLLVENANKNKRPPRLKRGNIGHYLLGGNVPA